MSILLWISVVLFVHSGRSERHHVRHERTRYMVAGSSLLADGNDDDEAPSYMSRALSSSEAFGKSSKYPRPLFSWDTPTEEFSAVSSSVNAPPPPPEAIKPEIWHVGEAKPRPFLETVTARKSFARKNPYLPRARPVPQAKKDSIAFRKSYVYKAVTSEEAAKPTPSKKIFRVVYGSGRKKPGRGRKAWRKRCRNPNGCPRTRRPQTTGNDINVEYFPKGLAPARPGKWPAKTDDRRRAAGGAWAGPCVTGSCDQICTEENSRAICSCYPGFVLVNETKCVDVDECATNNGGCEGICVNTVGSRECSCWDGFRLSATDDRCMDVNECTLRNGHGPCQDTCINTKGSYYCSCEGLKGTVLAADNHSCEEINECDPKDSGCSHACIITFGRAFCMCPDGYELGEDWKTCHDVDECSDLAEQDMQCEFGCVNTPGSYYCEMKNILHTNSSGT